MEQNIENNDQMAIEFKIADVKMDLTVVLPIKSAATKRFDELFHAAIMSLKTQVVGCQELIIVHTDETALVEFLDGYDFSGLDVKRLVWTDEPSFAKQVNHGVSNAKTKWVTILEFDDEYSKIWFKNAMKYSQIYKDVDVFLPIVVDVDDKAIFAGFTNEATFAANFSQEMGYLTNETLLQYQNFQTSGMVFKKSLIEDFGGFKPNIKLTFVYELLLRLTYNSAKIMTIPKIGYKHTNLREGSIFWEYKNGETKLEEDEIKFWVSSAKKEYFFSEDRNIKFVTENV
jgi:hypothetical protein